MGGLVDILGGEWTDLVKQATPTGCASFQMSADATTVHQLLGLCLAPKHDLEPREEKMLEEKFKNVLCLLVIDEFSMVSRTMIGIVLGRLQNGALGIIRTWRNNLFFFSLFPALVKVKILTKDE